MAAPINKGHMNPKRVAFLGLFIALAFVMSYIEFLLPISMGIPGAKIGLANLVIVVALFCIGKKDAFILSAIRVLLVGLTFGNMAMTIYSLAGATLSFGAMLVAKRIKKLSVTGVSVVGGVFHNIGQIIVAMIIMETSGLIYYLPFLLVVGTISGVVIGVVASMIIVRVQKSLRF